jgi:undecaprenyl-diphosphatase
LEGQAVIVYLVLGIIQGLTEFLPISSSGHLVLAERLLGLAPSGLICEACLHLGTLASILVVFHSDLADLLRALTPRGSIERRKEIGLLVIGTVPVVAVGLALRSAGDAWFHSLWTLGIGWLATAALLFLAGWRSRRREVASPSAAGSLAIGVAQAVALAPGVSRSGFSIGAGILVGLRPERAARFSFLLAIPALAGAAGLSLWDGLRAAAAGSVNLPGILLGAMTAFIVGLVALRALIALVTRGRLWPFAIYCGALSIVSFALAVSSLP